MVLPAGLQPATSRLGVRFTSLLLSIVTQRGYGVGLPSGEAVARHLGMDPLTSDQIGIGSTGGSGEPLLCYHTLREADVCTGGHRLGPVGGRIVTEVLVGLIDADPTSFRQHSHEWRPKKTLSELLAS